VNTGEHGFALLAVLWVTIALSLIAVSLIATTRSDASLIQQLSGRLQDQAAADACINLAVLALIQAGHDNRLPTDGTEHGISFDNRAMTISIQDETGKIDLNMTSKDFLSGLFQVLGVAPGEASALGDAVVMWRGRTGGTQAGIGSAGPRGPRNAPFESVDELIGVPGMTRTLMDQVRGYVTVYSQRAQIDQSIAAPEVLLADPTLSKADVEAIMRDRKSKTNQQAAFAVAAGQDDLLGRAFSIKVSAADGPRSRLVRSVIIRLTGEVTLPFWMLAIER